MRYRVIAPRPELADVVECLWTLDGRLPADGMPEPVLPDGRPEIIFHLGDPFERIEADGRSERQPHLIYAGQLGQQLLLRPVGRTAVLGIRFHPHGATALLPNPQHELAGNPIPLDAIAGRLNRTLDPLHECVDLDHAAALAQQTILRALDRSRVDPRVVRAVFGIEVAGGCVSVEELARVSGLTCRHLERRFLQDVGVTPKRLARIARFQRALRSLERAEGSRRGTDTAAACGYADQSHFIRDFRLLAGCSPSEHLLREGELTRFFYRGDQKVAPDLPVFR